MQTILPYSDMHSVVKEGRSGAFAIQYFTMTEPEIKHEKMMSVFRGNYGEVYDLRPGRYVRLVRNDTVWMSDTPMERRTNLEFLANAHGHVLIAGLGIGLVLIPLLKSKDVLSVEVVENSSDVIDLVGPSFRSRKLKITQGDIFTIPVPPRKWNTIYFDIWCEIDGKNYEETKTLVRRFTHNLDRSDPEAWIGAWRRDDMRRLAKEA